VAVEVQRDPDPAVTEPLAGDLGMHSHGDRWVAWACLRS
jgi:hypothetical protein